MSRSGPVTLSDLITEHKMLWAYCCACGRQRDLVVHDQFPMDRGAQTERILRAVANTYVTVLGHMTGRQLLRRPGYEVEVKKILATCAKPGVAVEINSNPLATRP
jgi:histidinol phosphatase-like PHP family hydrolase